MKTAKKLCALLFALTLAAALTVPAFADLIWEPRGDFWTAHAAECTQVNGDVREAQKETDAYADPSNPRIGKTTVPVGDTRSILWIWTDAAGEAWGYSAWDDGWVRLADFRQLYTESIFCEEHADEIVSETGALPFSTERAYISYAYPGSGETSTRFGGVDSIGAADPNFRYDKTYTDEAGRKWGAATYSGRYHFWVCLSDPYNDELPRTAPKYADEAAPVTPAPIEPTPAPIEPTPVEPTPAEGPDGTEEYEIHQATVGNDAPPAQPTEGIEHPGTPAVPAAPATPEAPAAEQASPAGLIVGLVAAVAAVSAALLVILRRKKRD